MPVRPDELLLILALLGGAGFTVWFVVQLHRTKRKTPVASPQAGLGGIIEYQPDRQDILWNTDWGVPGSDLPREEAEKRGLVLSLNRWVSSEEKKTLQEQRLMYILVRGVIPVLLIIEGIVTICGVFFVVPL
ncbi:MAG: hypothetical protein AB1646_10635 [Thermodesulfobacteriota bacterium]